MIRGKHIAVWFSCGAASAIAAKLTLEIYGEHNRVSIINNPIAEEHPDNRRFLADVEKWLGQKIELAISSKYPDSSCETVWGARRFMSGIHGAPCTLELKKIARQEWENLHKPDHTVLGFTYEETKRADRFRLTERDTLITPLIDERVTKRDCFDLLRMEGIQLPEIYSLGYPNANCIGCVKATSATYWNLVRTTFPDVFEKRSVQSREIGAKLAYHKGDRIYLDQLPADAKGRAIKGMDTECGIFCEEKEPTPKPRRVDWLHGFWT